MGTKRSSKAVKENPITSSSTILAATKKPQIIFKIILFRKITESILRKKVTPVPVYKILGCLTFDCTDPKSDIPG